MSHEEVLKSVFPLLDGKDLASCQLVCKRWSAVARDDYYWKCQCAKRWPSICKRPIPPTESYYKLFQTFYRRQHRRTLAVPRLSFVSLEFYIDIWTEDTLVFSEVVPGLAFEDRIKTVPSRVSDLLRYHLEGPEYKLTLPVEPGFGVPLSHNVSVSVLVARTDTNKVARLINKSLFDYIDRSSYRALAFDYLDFSPNQPFMSGIRAWFSLLFREEEKENENEGPIDVVGIQMDFCDIANSKKEVLWLLDMLDWK